MNQPREFSKELSNLLNSFSKENESDTPDWILADFLEDCLVALSRAINERERWYSGAKKEESHEPTS